MRNAHYEIDLLWVECVPYGQADLDRVISLKREDAVNPPFDSRFELLFHRGIPLHELGPLHESGPLYGAEQENLALGSFWLMNADAYADIEQSDVAKLQGNKFICKFDVPLSPEDLDQALFQAQMIEFVHSWFSRQGYFSPISRSENGIPAFYEARYLKRGSIEFAVGFGVAYGLYKAIGEYPKFRDGAIALGQDLHSWKTAISDAIFLSKKK